jgi:hypothetical protein
LEASNIEQMHSDCARNIHIADGAGVVPDGMDDGPPARRWLGRHVPHKPVASASSPNAFPQDRTLNSIGFSTTTGDGF